MTENDNTDPLKKTNPSLWWHRARQTRCVKPGWEKPFEVIMEELREDWNKDAVWPAGGPNKRTWK